MSPCTLLERSCQRGPDVLGGVGSSAHTSEDQQSPSSLPEPIKPPTLLSVSSVSLLSSGLVRVEMNLSREAFIQVMYRSVCMDLE